MKSSLRSTAPERAWNPMSKVPPSPAQVTTVVSVSPFMSRAARTPLATAPPVSKAEWMTGIFSVVVG
ncbi:MAG: hypothetical protein A4E67_00572 [Syntrophaceae bacterium PtaB.Bin038]|nr:MAG: hypothetical protein A4E67_00572 [Syntrophaceae bacterium PtaB.Bin038]